MKKNKMMRLASVLLIAVLMSTCAISGTFAKYVTANSGSDTAQVAKFGVKIDINDDLGMFKTQYAKEDSEYTGSLSVNSGSDTRLVAPGTKGEMSFVITGTPEVATRVSIAFGAATKAIQLPAGEYTLPAGYWTNTEFTLETTEVYEPIKFYFGTTPINGETEYTLTLEELKTAMNTAFTKDYNPLHDLGQTYYLGWSWAFDVDADTDFLDTYLGYVAATGTADTEVLNFTITVTQID